MGRFLQRSSLILDGSSTRTIFLMLLIFIIFLYTSYSAYIVVLLQSTSSNIKTLKDLYESGYAFGAHDIVYNRQHFKSEAESGEPVRKAIYENRIMAPGKKEGFYSVKEGIAKTRKEQFAFYVSYSPGFHEIQRTWDEREKCGLNAGIKYLGDQMKSYVFINRASPLREVIRIGFRRLAEHGLSNRMSKRFYLTKPECQSDSSSFVSVGVMDTLPAFLIVIYGYSIALGILILEMVYKYLQ